MPRRGEALGSRVVVGETLDVVVERVEARGRDHPAWRIAPPNRCFSRQARSMVSAGPGEDRAERAAETLREAQRDGVEVLADRRRRDVLGDRGVEQPGTVEMHTQALLACQRRDIGERGERKAATARGVVRRLQSARTAGRWSADFVPGYVTPASCSDEIIPFVPSIASIINPACAAAPPYS